MCPSTRRRLASRRRPPPVATWSATRTRRGGGPWPTPKATRSTSPVGRTATDRDLGSYGSTPALAITARKWALSCNVISGRWWYSNHRPPPCKGEEGESASCDDAERPTSDGEND